MYNIKQDNQLDVLNGSPLLFLSVYSMDPSKGKGGLGEKYKVGTRKTPKDAVIANTIINLNSLSWQTLLKTLPSIFQAV